MRAMARVILPEEVFAESLSDRDLEEEIAQKEAADKREQIRNKREALLRTASVSRRP